MRQLMRLAIPGFSLAVLCCGQTTVFAQSRGNTGGSSMFPTSSFSNSGGFSSGASSSSMFGGSSASGARPGMGGTGSGFGSTGSGFGSTGFGQTGNSMQNAAGAFIGRNLDANSFIGRTAQGTQGGGNGQNNRMGQGGRGGQRNNTDLQQLLGGNQFGGQNQNQNNGMMGRSTGIRPRLKVGFEAATPAASSAVEVTRARFEKLSSKHPQLSVVGVEMASDGSAVLTGDVASQSDARLAENLLRLEPGIRKVRNELRYPEPSATE